MKASASRPGAEAGDAVGYVRVDARGVVREWDARMVELLGYRTDEMVGRSMEAIVPESYRARHWAGFHAAMAHGMPEGHQPALNVPLRHKDGVLRMHPAREVFLCDAFGKPVGVLAIIGPPCPEGEENGLRSPFADALDPPSRKGGAS